MTTVLYWKPAISDGQSLSDELKFALRKRLGEGGGSLAHTDLEYLRGLSDAGITGAKTLIEAIEKHYQIQVWEE